MKKHGVKTYIALGGNINFLRLALPTSIAKGELKASGSLERLLTRLEELELKFSLRLARRERAFELLEELQTNPSKELGERADKIRELADLVAKAVLTEADDRFVFSLNQKFISSENLMDTPDKIFGKHVWPCLEEHIKKDLSEASLCLAFERYTASAMHLMRGVEGVLRKYYKKKIKKTNRIKEPWLWGGILDELEKADKKKYAFLIGQLRPIKNEYRNKSQHSGKHYAYEEVENMWHVSIEAINRMCKDL